MSTIGQNIKYYRLCAGWSQRELARQANVSLMSVRRYEEEKGVQSLNILKAISAALNIPIRELVDETKDLPKRAKIRVPQKEPHEQTLPETENFTYLDIDKSNKARYKKGLSQSQLAKMTGVSRYTIIKALAGKRINVRTAEKIERVLGIWD